MKETDDLQERIDRFISEFSDILSILEVQLENCSASSFRQAKEIDETAIRLKRQGLSVPPELMQIRLKYLADAGKHERLSSLVEDFQGKIESLLDHSILRNHRVPKERSKKANSKRMSPPNRERPLGSKGNSNLEDYLIPVIQLMNKGNDYTEAFHKVANKLDVRYNTVSSQCTRALGLLTEEFVSRVKAGTIIALLEEKYPDQVALIRRETISFQKERGQTLT
jgi:hypothetical protein